MILLNDFFTIDEKTVSDTEIKTQLHINAGHRIFEGHFPNQPVVPGVCMMQMIKEILEHILGKETNLVQATDMKFLAIINPQEKNLIQASIKYVASESGKISIQATLYKDELVHFKFKGQLQAS
ncbi:MAG: 3-hydroxyacyl-ACP dehydratase [Ferruginibacter sp.]|nr:3-hydroxyacyl-ACP dehydratase [Bacteroidota bacterium]MBX2918274.1 3-hydroxyacyl-ACP dehydratase [Ferruginibacter sp.]MCC7380053.1 3-hydroxyacyl-ACP dehydratase [Chitinophagaceae bacterium]